MMAERTILDKWKNLEVYGKTAANLVELTQPKKRHIVLDVATGKGSVALAMSPHVRKVVALDSSEKMLGLLRKSITEKSITNIDVVQTSVERYKPACSFDLITSVGGLSNLPNPERAFGRLRDMLKPRGRIALVDCFIPGEIIDAWRLLSVFRYGHRREYLPYSFVASFEQSGFQMEHYIPWGFEQRLSTHEKEAVGGCGPQLRQAVLSLGREQLASINFRKDKDDYLFTYPCFYLVGRKKE